MAQLAKAVNQVLTKTYNLLYTEGDGNDADSEDPPQLKLQTAPLASSEEVEKLFAAQIIDLETALPAAMHALGATADEVEHAMERGRNKEQKKCDCEDEDRAMQKQDIELGMKERTLGLKKAEAVDSRHSEGRQQQVLQESLARRHGVEHTERRRPLASLHERVERARRRADRRDALRLERDAAARLESGRRPASWPTLKP